MINKIIKKISNKQRKSYSNKFYLRLDLILNTKLFKQNKFIESSNKDTNLI